MHLPVPAFIKAALASFSLGLILLAPTPLLAAELPFHDPLFDIHAIETDPLDAKTLKGPTEKDGVMVEEIEYTSQVHQGKPNRIFGILAYPKGAKHKPAVFFSMPGKAPASEWWSSTFAKKGYVTLTVTIQEIDTPPSPTVDGKPTGYGNLTNQAIQQMRGITYLAQRPEVDKDRIGVGGGSYGGFFATLIAGADPRIKCGMSFFAGGHQELGTNIGMFTGMATLDDAKVWDKTIDPAWRLAQRKVPFIWGVPTDDHWFYFPSLVQTYADSAGEKWIGLLPHWAHAFDENMDNELIDFFDTQLARPEDGGKPAMRAPYNHAGDLTIKNIHGKLTATWGWTGANPVKHAQLVVSYGPDVPWSGWVYRYHHPIDAKIEGQTASAEIPVPETKLPIVIYGNTFDDHGVLISTMPKTIVPADMGIKSANDKLVLNCYPLGGFEPADVTHLVRTGIDFGKADTKEMHGGTQSIRMDAPTGAAAAQPKADIKLLNVPEHGHTLRVWLKASEPTTVVLTVAGAPPAHWGDGVVNALRHQRNPNALPAPAAKDLPRYTLDAKVTTTWKEFTLECPFKGVPVEGYNLTIQQKAGGKAAYWMDDLRFEPKWSGK